MEEFYQQGEKELTLGLPLTTFPNRKNFDYIFARHQNGFLVNVVARPCSTSCRLCDFDTRERSSPPPRARTARLGAPRKRAPPAREGSGSRRAIETANRRM